MSETVRLVADGEELVLSQGEAFRIQSNAEARDAALESRRESAAPKRIAIDPEPVKVQVAERSGKDGKVA